MEQELELPPLVWVPPVFTDTRVVIPVIRLCTKTSPTLLVSPDTRFGAMEKNATYRPSAEMEGLRELPVA